MNVFVYGTLMTDEIFNRVVFGENIEPNYYFKKSKAILKDHKRFSAPNREYPGVRPISNQFGNFQVEGMLIEGLLKHHIEALDKFEGSEYQRVSVLVKIANKDPNHEELVYADIYMWKEDFNQDILLSLPKWDLDFFKINQLNQWMINGDKFVTE